MRVRSNDISDVAPVVPQTLTALATINLATCSSANATYRGNGANPVPPLGNGVRAMLSTMARNV